MAKKYVYSFGRDGAEGNKEMKDTLGGKGANLAEMCNTGVPVPPGFTVSTEVCNIYFNNNRQVPAEVDEQIKKALTKVEKELGKKLGDPKNPLLMSVRSGAKFSMPGMMNTILNLGLNDETTEGLASLTGNPRFAYDCYRRFIQMFGEVALGIEMEEFDHVFNARKAKIKAKLDTDLSSDDLQAVIADTRRSSAKKRARTFRRTRGNSSRCHATPYSVRGGLTRPATTGRWKRFPMNSEPLQTSRRWCLATWARPRARASASRATPAPARRSSTVSFWSTPRVKTWWRESVLRTTSRTGDGDAGSLSSSCTKSRRSSRSPTKTSRTSSSPSRKARYTCCRPATVSVRVRPRFASRWRWRKEGLIDKKTAVMRVEPQQLDQLLHPVFDMNSLRALPKIAKGIAASPGRRGRPHGVHGGRCSQMSAKSPVILLRKETTPNDIHGMDVAKGILTAVGGAS